METEINKFNPREEIINYTKKDWDSLTEEDFKKIFKNSAVKRTKFIGLKRNIDNNNNY